MAGCRSFALLSLVTIGFFAAIVLAQSDSVRKPADDSVVPTTTQRPAKHGVVTPAHLAPCRDCLTLGEVTFDPVKAVPLPPAGWNSSFDDPAGRNLRLVQFTGPIQEHWHRALEATGLKIVQYIYPNAYIVWSTGAELNAIDLLPEVRWTGEFYPAYRVLPQWRNLNAQAIEVDIMIYRGANVDAAVTSIQKLGGQLLRRNVMDKTFEVAGFVMPGNIIKSAA